MNIKLSKDAAMPGVFRASFGKRKVIISLSRLDVAMGRVPTDDDCRKAFNDTSSNGDAIAGPLVSVWRMDVGSMLKGKPQTPKTL